MRTQTKPRRAGLTTTLILATGTFATGTDAFNIAGLLPSLADSLHASVANSGRLVTVFSLAYAVGSPLITSDGQLAAASG